MRINRLVPMLGVSDLERTIAFYCGELGFRCAQAIGEPCRVWCYLERDGVAVMFNQPPTEVTAESLRSARDLQIFYFYTDDVMAQHAVLKAKGLTVTDLRVTVYNMKEFELRDPDGYWLWFGQGTSEPPTVEE